MTAFHQGALLGRRILLDPEFGGEASGTKSPWKIRAADQNMRFARRLAHFLALAGAEVHFTRMGNQTRTPFQRVEQSLEREFDLAMSIGHDSLKDPACRIYHYAASEPARQIGQAVSRAAVSVLGLARCKGPLPYSNTFLQQTPCPALRVSVSGILLPDTSNGYNEYAAYAISAGLALSFRKNPDFRAARIVLPDSIKEQNPHWARIDGELLLPVLTRNTVMLLDLDKTSHTLQITLGPDVIWDKRFLIQTNGKVRFE